ncbi:MAG: hypothetical protein WDA16_06825 [Candidatus Thermoplasmatota archaeon]
MDRRTPFPAGACVDLGAFDPREDDCAVGSWLAHAHDSLDYVVMMEDRQPDFFHGYRGYEPGANVPLNRHGPRTDAWVQADLKRLVAAFRARGVKVLFGYWIHECSFVDDLHPELLIRDQHGNLWQDEVEMNADFNPMRRMTADAANDIGEGERYSAWSARQYAKLERDFGFDGLFLGDGAMGFRRHGKDWKDLRHFDFHESWLAEFVADAHFMSHEGCALAGGASHEERSRDVHIYHWPHWVAWNTDRWTAYYREMAAAVHATGGILAAYNCMNYDPALARLHGVDYRAIAQAGLDIMVFQAYDYAWGPLGPFGFLHIAKKDVATNLRALLRIRAHVGHDTNMRIVLTVETEDEVEGWNAPAAHTLGELHAYGHAASFDGHHWRRALDGAFVVWGNSVTSDEWRLLADAFHHLTAAPPAPSAALVWTEGEERAIAERGAPSAVEPEHLYAHFDVQPALGDGSPDSAILTSRHAAMPTRPLSTRAPVRAPLAQARTRVPKAK